MNTLTKLTKKLSYMYSVTYMYVIARVHNRERERGE